MELPSCRSLSISSWSRPSRLLSASRSAQSSPITVFRVSIFVCSAATSSSPSARSSRTRLSRARPASRRTSLSLRLLDGEDASQRVRPLTLRRQPPCELLAVPPVVVLLGEQQPLQPVLLGRRRLQLRLERLEAGGKGAGRGRAAQPELLLQAGGSAPPRLLLGGAVVGLRAGRRRGVDAVAVLRVADLVQVGAQRGELRLQRADDLVEALLLLTLVLTHPRDLGLKVLHLRAQGGDLLLTVVQTSCVLIGQQLQLGGEVFQLHLFEAQVPLHGLQLAEQHLHLQRHRALLCGVQGVAQLPSGVARGVARVVVVAVPRLVHFGLQGGDLQPLRPLELLLQAPDGGVTLGAVQQRLLQFSHSPGQLVDLVVALRQIALRLLIGCKNGGVVLRLVFDDSLETLHLQGRRGGHICFSSAWTRWSRSSLWVLWCCSVSRPVVSCSSSSLSRALRRSDRERWSFSACRCKSSRSWVNRSVSASSA
ncbi:hypothetical protein EYF80_056115 [Liparis tanakae]|uniref:Uncharacterized protein n=1 Tax=Liparis tanakae TaxID=230148 RepID=A0A4Z2EY94_9TELE|nr:hypothetical protein EYF80_056115 [Liparis tanakae]